MSNGWVHHENQLSPERGVEYKVRYVGAYPVLTSIKSVDFDKRTQIARECIHRVSEAVGLKLQGKRKQDPSISKLIGNFSNMDSAMCNATILINTNSISLTNMDTKSPIASHTLFNISFASGGDADTMDMVSYVAKDSDDSRFCYVIECAGSLAKDIITTIGQAFEIRHREFTRTNALPSVPVVAPNFSRTTDNGSFRNNLSTNGSAFPSSHWNGNASNFQTPRNPSNLYPSVPSMDNTMDFNIPNLHTHHIYSAVNKPSLINFDSTFDTFFETTKDVLSPFPDGDLILVDNDFDPRAGEAQPFIQSQQPPVSVVAPMPSVPTNHNKENGAGGGGVIPPLHEKWYLGGMSRLDAENLLTHDGDFLVRASLQQPGQFILSGRQNSKCKHLLLVDPNGEVRTKDRVFDSISHLIQYHIDHGMPIKSADSELQLIYPITSRQKAQ